MHVAVLGAGIAGATTAYYLVRKGHTVTVIDSADGVATQTSYANGAQLSYSYTDSLAQPGFVQRIPGLVLGIDAAIRVSGWRNLALAPWGIAFLAQCTQARARANTLAVLDIAMRSARLLEDLRSDVDIDFAWRRPGKIAVIASASELAAAEERSAWKRERGCDVRVIDYDEALELEPALAHMRQRFAGAVYSPDDEVGDAHAFAGGLIEFLQSTGNLEVRLGERVEAIDIRQARYAGVRTDRGELTTDAAVVCLGPWSSELLAPLGIDPGIYPIRGYSVTLPAGESPPSVSITNIEKRLVYSLLGKRVRISGFADFVGYETCNDTVRIELLLSVARELAPQAADYDAANIHPWGGFRPVTPDSRPVAGPSRVPGLFLNTGHGILGWTLACATASDVAEALSST